MRIVVAIKKLRQACMAASSMAALASRRPLQNSGSTNSLNSSQSANGFGSAPSSPTYAMSPGAAGAGAAVVAQAQVARRVSNGRSAHRVPPPLHLAQSSVSDARLPLAYQSLLTPGSGSNGSTIHTSVSTSPAGSVSAMYGARSSSNKAALLAPSSIVNYGNAPQRVASSPHLDGSQPPAPRSQPPPSQAQQLVLPNSKPTTNSARSQLAAPTISTTAASPTATSYASDGSSWSHTVGEYNSLRKQGRPVPGGNAQHSHRKAGSTGGSISPIADPSNSFANTSRSAQTLGRPSTAAASYQQHHPSTAVSSSHTNEVFQPNSGSGSSLSKAGSGGHRPVTAPQESRSYKTANGSLGLSPILESNSAAVSFGPADQSNHYASQPAASSSSGQPISLKAQQQSHGYTVGKGGFARPTTAAGTVSITPGGSATTTSGQVVTPFEEVMRKTVKFVGEDGVSKMVNVDGARDAYDVFLRTLKKFGKVSMNRLPDPLKEGRNRNEQGEVLAEMDGYSVFASTAEGLSKSRLRSGYHQQAFI